MFAAAEIAKLSPKEYTTYIKSLGDYRDIKNSIDTAKQEGIEKGKAEEKLEIAKNAKDLGLSVEQIQKLTGLSINEIEKL